MINAVKKSSGKFEPNKKAAEGKIGPGLPITPPRARRQRARPNTAVAGTWKIEISWGISVTNLHNQVAVAWLPQNASKCQLKQGTAIKIIASGVPEDEANLFRSLNKNVWITS